MSFRVVVTGSRHWTDGEAANLIRNKMMLVVHQATEMGPALMSGMCVSEAEIVIAHGGARGADSIADAFARKHRWRVEVFPADWQKHGPPGGPIRNKAMLDAGADLVLAFPFGGRLTSPGTWNCVDLAAIRGIPVAVFARSVLEGTVAR